MNLEKNKQALLNLPKPKAIIFDWDNTLVNTWPLIQEAIDNTMISMGREPWGLKKVKDNIHKAMRDSFPEIFGSDWQKAGEIYKNSYRDIHLEKIELLPNVKKLIEEIGNSGILQIIISNKIGVTLRKEVSKIGIDENFFSIIGSMDSNFDKPHIKPVELALLGSGLNCKKDEIWFVGDTISDLECALNSGCRPIIYGMDDGAISKTISSEILVKNNVAIYFDHQELINVISNLKF